MSTGEPFFFRNSPGNLTDTNPFLNPLADYGGGTETRSFPDGLAPGQDHIPHGEAGCGTTVRFDQTGTTHDQRGILRLFGCDVGAFQIVNKVFVPLVTR